MRRRELLHKHLRYFKGYIRLIFYLKKIRLRGGKASLYRTLLIFFDKVADNQLFERANGVAFNFTLSIFPSIIFLFTLIPFIHETIPYVSMEDILVFLSEVIPRSVFSGAEETLRDTVGIRREGLMSFGVLFALFLASNGMNSLMKTFNASYRTVEKRGFFKMRLISLFLTLILALAFIISITLLVLGQIMIERLWVGFFSQDLINYIIFPARFMIIFAFFYLAIASIYYWGPAIHDRWRFFSLGSILATSLCLAGSFAFSVYVNQFSAYNKVYGSIGTLIALMIWQYLMSAILLLGFEFNASIDRAASGKVYTSEMD